MLYPINTIIAIDQATGARVENGSGYVYAVSDTARVTPLSIFDLSGLPLTSNLLTTNSEALIPPFQVEGEWQVVFVSGDSEIILTSWLGLKEEAAASADAANEVATKANNGEFKGDKGDSAYQVWLSLGNTGTVEDYRADIEGPPGKDGSNVLPTDEAIEQAVTTDGTATNAALKATYGSRSGKRPVGQDELTFNIVDYGAVGDSNGAIGVGTDNALALKAANDAANAVGGRVFIPRGKFRSSQSFDILHEWYGEGGGYGGDVTSPASMLLFDNGVNGVRLMGRSSAISNLYLRGGTGDVDGITPGALSTRVTNCSVHGFGGHGYYADSTGAKHPEIINVDHSTVDGLIARSCGGDGFHLQGGPDVNALRLMNINSVGNGGWGVWVDAANRNWIQGHLAANVTGGVWDNSNSCTYDVYIESGSGASIVLGPNSIYGKLTSPNYAEVIPDVSLCPTAWETWNFEERNGGKRSLYLYDADGGPTPTGTQKTWRVDSGGSADGALQFTNVTDGGIALRLYGATGATIIGGSYVRPVSIGVSDIGSPTFTWQRGYFSSFVKVGAVASGSRPAASTAGKGAMIFDSTLGKPIWSNGTAWVDATGNVMP